MSQVLGRNTRLVGGWRPRMEADDSNDDESIKEDLFSPSFRSPICVVIGGRRLGTDYETALLIAWAASGGFWKLAEDGRR